MLPELPDECLFYLFGFLDNESLQAVSLTSKNLFQTVDAFQTTKNMLKQEEPELWVDREENHLNVGNGTTMNDEIEMKDWCGDTQENWADSNLEEEQGNLWVDTGNEIEMKDWCGDTQENWADSNLEENDARLWVDSDAHIIIDFYGDQVENWVDSEVNTIQQTNNTQEFSINGFMSASQLMAQERFAGC